ncbi:MAG: endonuclease NucS domain-containing protein, partial [Leptolyngbya sp.]|nr:endonuclease NucS domain-containing protein [Leptolyngbya sp.]
MLRPTETGWIFENETLLEDCLKQHLQALLGLQVIAQQYAINGQICDLVAVSDNGQLAILELKNQEDRYIIQQLTRYFDAFLAEKPFSDVADYDQPIRLLAIAPSFHRDTFIDRKYSHIQIEFLTFAVQAADAGYTLALNHLDRETSATVPISPPLPVVSPSIPSPPK